MSQVPGAGEAAMASLVWQRLCQQKMKLSIDLNFHQSVRPRVVRTGAGLLVSGKGLEVGARSPPRVPCFSFFFPHLCVFWPGRFVPSKLSVPRHLCGGRRLAQRCWVISGHVPTGVPRALAVFRYVHGWTKDRT